MVQVERERVYAIIEAEVLGEELVRRRNPSSQRRLNVSTEARRKRIHKKAESLLTEDDWRRVKNIIKIRINDLEEQQRTKFRQPLT